MTKFIASDKTEKLLVALFSFPLTEISSLNIKMFLCMKKFVMIIINESLFIQIDLNTNERLSPCFTDLHRSSHVLPVFSRSSQVLSVPHSSLQVLTHPSSSSHVLAGPCTSSHILTVLCRSSLTHLHISWQVLTCPRTSSRFLTVPSRSSHVLAAHAASPVSASMFFTLSHTTTNR